jgi:hypothetical protein
LARRDRKRPLDDGQIPNPSARLPLSNFVPRGFGFAHHSIAILYHQVPNPNLTIRNFWIRSMTSDAAPRAGLQQSPYLAHQYMRPPPSRDGGRPGSRAGGRPVAPPSPQVRAERGSVCVCVREREREREGVCVCVCERESEREMDVPLRAWRGGQCVAR